MSAFPLPNLFIPGFQKAGTSALAHFLSQHSEICLVKGKEAHVFDDPDFHRAADKQKFAAQKYAALLEHYNGEKYILDATPITLLHPQFTTECFKLCRPSKSIVMLREPVDRAFSHYAMTRKRGLEPFGPSMAFVCEPLRMRKIREKLPRSDFQHPYRDQSYLIRGRYEQQLKMLYRNVARDDVIVLDQNELLSWHEDSLRKIFAFLDLKFEPIEARKVFVSEPEDCSSSWLASVIAKLYFTFLK